MLIVCSGKDSYRSLEKAKALEVAYREKYDTNGFTVDRLPCGKDGIDRLLSITSSGSLFASRRFIRIDGLITDIPKAKRSALQHMLTRDVEMTIVVTVEEGDLTKTDLNGFTELPKFVHYAFPLLQTTAFLQWAMEHAKKFGITDPKCIRELAELSQGDSWKFVNVFDTFRAGNTNWSQKEEGKNIFGIIDALLAKSATRKSDVRAYGDGKSVIAQIVHQARTACLVKGGYTEGVHSFVVKKMNRMNVDTEERFRSLVTAFVWSRNGYADADEALDFLG